MNRDPHDPPSSGHSDLERRLARFRKRIAVEGRPSALGQIDKAIADARSSQAKARER